jgi:fucose permease
MNEKTSLQAHPSWHPILLLAIAYLGFVSLGLPDPISGVAWPSVRDLFSLPQSAFGLVFIALGCGYCASGFFGGSLTLILGLGNLLWVSSGLVAIAMFGFGLAPNWPVFVAFAVTWGLGSGGIDAGLNAYVSNHFSARHVNWLHACYSLGATIGPMLMTAMLFWTSWRVGYAVVGGLLALMTLCFLITRQRWDEPAKVSTDEAIQAISMRETLRDRLVWLQIVVFFLYVGVEFTVGQWSFTILTESRHVRADVAGLLASGYYGAIGIGRIIAGVIAAKIGLDQLVRAAMLLALAGTTLFAFGTPVELSCVGLVLIGLGLAPIFPCLMAITPQRLGTAQATHAVGFQVSSGMLGAALLPGCAGLLSDAFGLELITYFALTLALLLFTSHELIINISRHRR